MGVDGSFRTGVYRCVDCFYLFVLPVNESSRWIFVFSRNVSGRVSNLFAFDSLKLKNF